MTTTDLEPHVLLVEDNLGDARLVEHHLHADHVADIVGTVTLQHETTLSDGLSALESNAFDILFLDLGLPESTGRDTLGRILEADLDTPLVVLTGLNDRNVAITAIQQGAQDYILKDDIDADTLARSLRYAIERHEQEAELRRQNERLEDFASVVSHDLRNPLNVAQGHLENARGTQDNEHLEITAEALDRMRLLIDDLLTLARQGDTIDEHTLVNLQRLADDCWRNVDTEDATLEITTDQVVVADERRLQQLTENLIRNAIDHAGPNVTVTIGPLDDGFYIEDDGTGITPEDRPHIFEKGYTTSTDGTGFGLMIVQVIANAHGWTITTSESQNGGARFEIRGVEVE